MVVGDAAAARGAPGDSRVARGATEVDETGHGTAGDAWATRGTIGVVEAAWGRNPGGTASAGREATRGSKPRGTTEMGWQASVVVEPTGGIVGSQWWKPWNQTPKENLGQLDWGRQRVESCPHQKPHVERRSNGLWRDQGNDSPYDQRSSQGRHVRWIEGRAYVALWRQC
jgi:hypothetical protein